MYLSVVVLGWQHHVLAPNESREWDTHFSLKTLSFYVPVATISLKRGETASVLIVLQFLCTKPNPHR